MKVNVERMRRYRQRPTDARIVRTPGTLGGQPRLAGTRIPAALINGLLLDGFTAEQVQALYPQVTWRHVRAVQDWYAGPLRRAWEALGIPLDGAVMRGEVVDCERCGERHRI